MIARRIFIFLNLRLELGKTRTSNISAEIKFLLYEKLDGIFFFFSTDFAIFV